MKFEIGCSDGCNYYSNTVGGGGDGDLKKKIEFKLQCDPISSETSTHLSSGEEIPAKYATSNCRQI